MKINMTQKSRLYAGFVMMLSYCIFTLTAFLFYPTEFNPIVNWLSDLGNSEFNPRGAIFYNIGCIITAICLLFSIRIFNGSSDTIRWVRIFLKIGQICEIGVGITLILVGIYSEDLMTVHSKISAVLVLFLTYFLMFTAISLIPNKKINKIVPWFGIGMAIVAFIYGMFYNTPLMEWITIFGAIIYIQLVILNQILDTKLLKYG